MVKLKILRWAAMLALALVYLVKGQDRYRWLLHYLAGSGEDLHVKHEDMKEVLKTLAQVYDRAYDDDTDHLVSSWFVSENNKGARIGFWSTTLYDGFGFGHRPELFYLVGCFTYTVKFIGAKVKIVGADRYDWHDNGNGDFYTSPTPKIFARIMSLIFGEKYFPIAGFPMGDPGISNRLWQDMVCVGAKPFKTRFEISLPRSQFLELCRDDDEWTDM